MLVVREVLYCRPGKVRDLLEKFRQVNQVLSRMGYPPFQFMTDVSGERFWTLVLQSQVEDVATFRRIEGEVMSDPEAQAAMQGYHDLVVEGRREIYSLES
jgi:hypothetical protein